MPHARRYFSLEYRFYRLFLKCLNISITSIYQNYGHFFVADLLNFVVPSKLTLLGGDILSPSKLFLSEDLQERDAYLGIPLILILFVCQECSGSSGPSFSRSTAHRVCHGEPWAKAVDRRALYGRNIALAVFVHLPYIGMALPARFALFVSLVCAIILVEWIGQAEHLKRRKWHITICVLACAVLIPAPHTWTKLPNARFFAPGEIQRVSAKTASSGAALRWLGPINLLAGGKRLPYDQQLDI